MITIQSIFTRLNTLKAAHPDMIWVWHATSCVNIGIDDDKTRVYLKCVCPESYCKWPANTAKPYYPLIAMYELVDGWYSVVGAARKISYLEQMDWSRYDAMAARARDGLARMQEV